MAAPKEGGFKMSLGGLKGKVGFKASVAQKDAKRPRLALGDDNDDDDANKQQEISGWDAAEGGAVDIAGKKEKEAPRVIPALPNRDWRNDARRRLAKAPHAQVQNGAITEQSEDTKLPQYGLTILKKEDAQKGSVEEIPALAGPAEPMEDVRDSLTEEQRLEKKALDALVNGKPSDDDLVIPLHDEEERFRSEIQQAPDAPTLDAYEAMPVEGFGAALLRGMGWKDGDAIGKNGAPAKPKEFKRRPALLGIGAKEEAATGVDLGDFKGSKGKGKKGPQSYNPVALRNKVTGELVTEEELKAKLEQQNMVQDDKPKKERRKYSDDEDKDDRQREKRRDRNEDRNRDRRRNDDYDRERRRDRDRKDDGRRERDDYYDSDRRREKHKDKYRDDGYDSERRREKRRDRSRSPESDRRDKKRDRYRSRSRDSKRDRDRRDRSRDSDDRRKRRRDYEERDDRRRKH
jgi:hypothetical protein